MYQEECQPPEEGPLVADFAHSATYQEHVGVTDNGGTADKPSLKRKRRNVPTAVKLRCSYLGWYRD